MARKLSMLQTTSSQKPHSKPLRDTLGLAAWTLSTLLALLSTLMISVGWSAWQNSRPINSRRNLSRSLSGKLARKRWIKLILRRHFLPPNWSARNIFLMNLRLLTNALSATSRTPQMIGTCVRWRMDTKHCRI